MASAANQAAAGLSLSKFAQATDLKKRLWFTIGALVVFRLLSFVPLPGIDPHALASLFDKTNEGLSITGKPVFSVQHHPEASPGPQDAHYLFERFVALMDAIGKKGAG